MDSLLLKGPIANNFMIQMLKLHFVTQSDQVIPLLWFQRTKNVYLQLSSSSENLSVNVILMILMYNRQCFHRSRNQGVCIFVHYISSFTQSCSSSRFIFLREPTDWCKFSNVLMISMYNRQCEITHEFIPTFLPV